MKSPTDFALNEEYKRVKRLGDKLADIESLIGWEAFRPIVGDRYDNRSTRSGRPNIDEVVMVKLLVLQQWHGLSDLELEKQVADRISFMRFLGFSVVIPDFTTVWKFRDRLAADPGHAKADKPRGDEAKTRRSNDIRQNT